MDTSTEGSTAVDEPYTELRPLMFSIAYRMLGSASEAEDIVQEAFLRFHRETSAGTDVEQPKAYLSTVTTRLSIDHLRSARVRRERYVGTWLPEPLVTETEPDAARHAETADSLSMGSSGYLAAKSEQEVYAHEIAMEKEEIRLMPDVEEEELALLYEAKGIEGSRARAMAAEVMSDPARALDEQVREELKIGEAHSTPLKEGWVTGVATAVGAFIPVAPFLFLETRVAMWTSFAVAMLSHFAVGAARSVFTGRSIIRSGIDMFVVGLGVAVVGYVVGDLVARLL